MTIDCTAHPRRRRLHAAAALCVLAVVLFPCARAAAEFPAWRFSEIEASPAAPTRQLIGDWTVQLIPDDGTADGSFGVGGASARTFLWFQQFAAVPAFELHEIWVLFPPDPEIIPGNAIQLVVYEDADGDPSNGANLLLALDEVVQVADGATFSVYTLAEPLTVSGSGDLLIGVVSRFVESGVTPMTQPAALDTSAGSGTAWVATWIGDPPDPPLLPPDEALFRIDAVVPGDWLIRGFGRQPSIAEIPALGGAGMVVFAILLIALAWWALGRYSPR